ncbi:MAG TPA: ABC transporter substrate-binding protein [Candidatus Baltobacteraceae bacterium]|nr:ABC transporter substrate-binding protein [Candidatus Baltobacteraceae bacterium]
MRSKPRRRFRWRIPLLVCLLFFSVSVRGGDDKPVTLRLGFFPNITHAQALYARATGLFEKNFPIRWTAFDGGPTAIEALFADEIDATFIGPGPTINGYVRSHGEKFVIIAGAASGGAALVVRGDSGILTDRDFGGKTIATPQLANTQDISARIWFRDQGYRDTASGGTVNLIALSNPDQMTMFQEKQIDGAWTIEPWVSRLILEAGGRMFLDEKDLWPGGKYVTTQLIVSRAFLASHADEVRNLLRAHIKVTQLIQTNPAAALTILNEQIRKETTHALNPETISRALQRVQLTWDPIASSLDKDARAAYQIHFLRQQPDLTGIYDLTLLNQVLAEDHLPPVTNQPTD